MPEIVSGSELFFQDWDAQKSFFELESSGSTGPPKTISLSRNALETSAKITGTFLGVRSTDSIFCCLPVNKISGFMQLVRSRVWNLPIQIVQPASNPFLSHEVRGTITSLTSMQLSAILQNPGSRAILNQFRVVLVGGGDISESLELEVKAMDPMFYHTYGMTETCSHIALRRLNQDRLFQLLDGVEIALSNENCLRIKGRVTNDLWIETNDLAEVKKEGFRILGRKDNVINSGGIKIIPEILEEKISNYFRIDLNAILVVGVPDEALGQRMVLVLDKSQIAEELPSDFEFIDDKKQRPKSVYYLDNFILTETGKPRRSEIRKILLEKMKR